MNRSFRAQESQMQGSAAKQRQQLRASMMKEKEEDLALFLEMRRREKELDDLLLNSSEEFDAPLESKPGTSPIFNTASAAPARKTGADDFLSSESDKNDYDWLLTPPGTPLFPSLELESHKTVISQMGTPKARPTALKSRLANAQPEHTVRNSLASRQLASSPGLNTSSAGARRPSSSGGPGSRPATPTGRPTLNAVSKPSRSSTPTSRTSLPSTRSTLPSNRPTASATKQMASATRLTATTATKPAVPSRSTTPLSRSMARSSTPTGRPSLPLSKPTSVPPSKPVSRSATPTCRPSTLSSAPSVTGPPVKSSLVRKPASTTSRNPVPSRGTSPTPKARPWNPSEMPGFSHDTPPNLRTSAPERPLSAARGRPGAPSPRSSSVEPGSATRPRRQSCSPSRGRPPNGVLNSSGGSVPAISRWHSKANDNVSPVLYGTKMVDRVMSMRKLVPPKQDEKHSPHGNLSTKSSSPDSMGFGRTLSKKSLDMAIRHMDIRKTIPGNLRPLMTNIPASSMYSVRSGPARSRTISVSDSPLATSSNASSEVSVNNNGFYLDVSEVDDNIGGFQSPASMRGSCDKYWEQQQSSSCHYLLGLGNYSSRF